MKIVVTDQFRHCAAQNPEINNPGQNRPVTSTSPDGQISDTDIDRLRWLMVISGPGDGATLADDDSTDESRPLLVIDDRPDMAVDLYAFPFYISPGEQDGLALEASLAHAGDGGTWTTLEAHLDAATVADLIPHALRAPDGTATAEVTLLDQVVGFTELVAGILTARIERERNFWAAVNAA